MSFASSSSDLDRQSRRLHSTLSPPTRTERPVTADRPDNSSNNSLRVSLSHRSVTTSASHARPPSNRAPMDPSSVANRSRTLSSPSMPSKSHRPSTAPGLSTIQARQFSAHTSRDTTSALKQSGRSQPNDGSSRATSFTLSKSRRSPERKSKTLPTIHAQSTSDTSFTIAQAPSSSSYKRAGDVSREANLSGQHSSPISEGVATTSNQARAASSSSGISRTFSLFSQKSVSDLRSGPSKPTQLPLSVEVPSSSTRINRSTSYSLSSALPSGSQPDQTLSPASLAPLRNSPVSLRTASTSFSSSPSPIRRTDSPRSHISIASPALDAIPQRLAVDDMKRLLSKPASVLSGSDSEGGYRSLGGPANGRRLGGGALSSDDDVTGGYRSSPGRLSGAFLSKSYPKLRVTSEQSHSDDDGPTFLNQSPVLPTSSSTMKRSPSFDKKRNLLKRRPSAEKKAASMGIFPASYTKSQKSGSSKSRSVSLNPLTRNRDGGVSEDGSGLTPAGALALAYKQRQEEEERRMKSKEEQEKKLSPADLPRPPALALRDPDSGPSASPIYSSPDPGLRTAADPGLDAPTTPCYSIFGSTSGKLVALGGPEDSWTELSLGAGFVQSLGAGLGIDPLERTTTTTTISGGLPKARPAKASSHSIGRSLSRKMSGRWRKGSFTAADIEWEKVEPPVNKAVDKDLEHIREHDRVHVLPLQRETTEERGRPSLQERRGQHRKSVVTGGELRVSVEQHAMPVENTSAQIVSSRQATPKSDSSAMDSPRSRKSEGGAGSGKLWKLMKRISTGGLRDKYVDDLPYEPPPPVPALPKDYLDMSGGPRSMDGHGHGAQPPNILTKFTQSRPSMAVPRSSSALPSGAPPPANSRPVTTTSTVSSTAYRQSTTTRSSSPVSSDVASSKFFNRAHSQRSSTSSYGEEIPPVPNTVVGEHIIPPHELYKLAIGVTPSDDTSSKGKSSSRKGHSTPRSASSPEKWTTPPSSGMGVDPPTLPSLPVPPSQRRNKLTKPTREPSPTIPAFSTEAPINTFASRKPAPPVEPQTLRAASPPRRPSRSPHRPSPTTSTTTSRVTSPLPSIPPSLPESATQNSTFDAKRASTASHATARPRSYASTFGGNGSIATAQFREKTVPVPVRTEQEKADMWDDLLERSARAGGTLHLNGGDGLASDLLRFSGVSTDLEIDFS